MKKLFTCMALFLVVVANAQLLSTLPAFVQDGSTPIIITFDATLGNKGLKDYNPTDVYVHIGVITNKSTKSSDWKHVPFAWATTNALAKCTPTATNKYTYTITGGLRTFFGLTDATETIQKIAVIFRNGAGTKQQGNADASDMYISVYDNGLYARIDNPFRHPTYVPSIETITKKIGDAISITANSSKSSSLKILLNGTELLTAANVTTLTANTTIGVSGNQQIIAEANDGTNIARDTINFVVVSSNTVAALPSGMQDGINYDANDKTAATLVLYAPYKNNVFVLGDFNNWQQASQYQMNVTPDGNRYWIRLTGLTPGTEYAYQYLIDGNLKVADAYTEKVLDPWNDQYIPAASYPNLKAYPTGKTTGIVSVLQTAKQVYNWKVTNFTRPVKSNLLVYELLLRDFSSAQTYQAVIDSLSYLKKLGINTIELMPVNEFEGNNSWGYNPDFYFAPDKIYGTENDLRRFVDACHAQGIAVVLDLVMNHSFGLSPLVQMYWDAANNKPAANNPWFYPDSHHPFNVGYDMNHNTQPTRDLVDRVVTHWLTNYKIDGFRWDLSKGFTDSTMNTQDVGTWSAYSQGRINIWKRIYDKMQAVSPNSYCILEHLGDNGEEAQLGNYGMMLWGNMNTRYSQATMGYPTTNADLSASIDRAFWSQRNLITYQESHDEERVAYNNKAYGAINGAYNVQTTATNMQRNAAAAAIFATIPGPKMIWQFGELGYDYSIGTCQNGTINNNNCRTDAKPIRWDYLQDASRKGLYDVYSKLFTMRNLPQYVTTFTTGSVSNNGAPTYDLAGTVKQIRVYDANLSVVAFANFGTSTVFSNINFPTTGNWYKYVGSISGSNSINVTNSYVWGFSLAPGDYAVFTSQDVNQVILPVNWLQFTATKSNGNVQLKWSVVSQTNNHYYEIERSNNGIDFSKIGTQSINSTDVNHVFTDNAPYNLGYYRIKQVDKDGKSSYSSTVKISLSSNVASNWQLYPNPAHTATALQLNTDVNKLEIAVTDVLGKSITKQTIANAKAGQLISIPVATLHNGVYLIKVTTEKGTTTEKILKN